MPYVTVSGTHWKTLSDQWSEAASKGLNLQPFVFNMPFIELEQQGWLVRVYGTHAGGQTCSPWLGFKSLNKGSNSFTFKHSSRDNLVKGCPLSV